MTDKPVTIIVVDALPDGRFVFRLQPRILASGVEEVGAYGVLLSDLVDQIAHAFVGDDSDVEEWVIREDITKIFEMENAAKDKDPTRRENRGNWSVVAN